MKQLHFEQFAPVCPVCRPHREQPARLTIAHVDQQIDSTILEGILCCSANDCCHEFPIIDGVPIILADVRSYIASQVLPLLRRHDLSEMVESLIGDCCGPGHEFDTARMHLSSYGWDHYGDLLSNRSDTPALPGSVRQLLKEGLGLLPAVVQGPILDVGCSVGRTTMDLAEAHDALVLGVDVNFSMLRVASRALTHGVVEFPLRENGMVFHQQRAEIDLPHREQIDFWLCDAACLPVNEGQFGLVSQLNVLDSVTSPHALLTETSRVLATGGQTIIGCPYDWTGSVTPVEGWIGGHSQRSPFGGSPEQLLSSLLEPSQPHAITGLQQTAEKLRVPWTVRMHNRSVAVYDVHMVAAEKLQSVV